MSSPQIDQVYHRLRQQIIRGHFGPGDRLKETTLAAEHGVSRTPVRETLSRLLAEGLVERIPHQGYSVARLTLRHLQETCEVRALLEGEAAARAAQNADASTIGRLRALAGYDFEIGDAKSYEAALSRNLDFHLAVAEAAHNDVLTRIVRDCLAQMNRYWSLGFGLRLLPEHEPELSDEPMQEGNREHLALIDALAAGDSDEARQVARTHVDRNRELMIRRLLSGAGPSQQISAG